MVMTSLEMYGGVNILWVTSLPVYLMVLAN